MMGLPGFQECLRAIRNTFDESVEGYRFLQLTPLKVSEDHPLRLYRQSLPLGEDSLRRKGAEKGNGSGGAKATAQCK